MTTSAGPARSWWQRLGESFLVALTLPFFTGVAVIVSTLAALSRRPAASPWGRFLRQAAMGLLGLLLAAALLLAVPLFALYSAVLALFGLGPRAAARSAAGSRSPEALSPVAASGLDARAEARWEADSAAYRCVLTGLGGRLLERHLSPLGGDATSACEFWQLDATTLVDLSGSVELGRPRARIAPGLQLVQLHTWKQPAFSATGRPQLITTSAEPQDRAPAPGLGAALASAVGGALAAGLGDPADRTLAMAAPADLAAVVERHRQRVAEAPGTVCELPQPPLPWRWKWQEGEESEGDDD